MTAARRWWWAHIALAVALTACSQSVHTNRTPTEEPRPHPAVPTGVAPLAEGPDEGLAAVVAAGLARNPCVALVEVQGVAAIAAELRLQATGLVRDDQRASPGQWQAAQWLVVVSSAREPERLLLQARLVDSQTLIVRDVGVAQGPASEELRLQDELVQTLGELLCATRP